MTEGRTQAVSGFCNEKVKVTILFSFFSHKKLVHMFSVQGLVYGMVYGGVILHGAAFTLYRCTPHAKEFFLPLFPFNRPPLTSANPDKPGQEVCERCSVKVMLAERKRRSGKLQEAPRPPDPRGTQPSRILSTMWMIRMHADISSVFQWHGVISEQSWDAAASYAKAAKTLAWSLAALMATFGFARALTRQSRTCFHSTFGVLRQLKRNLSGWMKSRRTGGCFFSSDLRSADFTALAGLRVVGGHRVGVEEANGVSNL